MKFQKFRKIGEGSCSKVYRAYDLNRREDIAIKVLGGYIDMGTLKNCGQLMIANEIKILQQLKECENVIKYIETISITDTKVCIIMELCQIDLSKLRSLLKDQLIPSKYIFPIIQQIFNGLDQIKSKKIFYRDLKLENILIKIHEDDLEKLIAGDFSKFCSAEYLISDFGNSQFYEFSNKQFTNCVGAYETMGNNYINQFLLQIAPEIFDGKMYDIRSLIYSLGIIIYQFISGNEYFIIDYYEQNVKPNRFQKEDTDINQIDEPWRKLITRMLKKEPDMRIMWDELRSILLKNQQIDVDKYVKLEAQDCEQSKNPDKLSNLKEQEVNLMKQIQEISNLIKYSYDEINKQEMYNKEKYKQCNSQQYDEERKKCSMNKCNSNHNTNYDNYMQFYKKNYPILRAKYQLLETYEINQIIGQKWKKQKIQNQKSPKKKAIKKTSHQQEEEELYNPEKEKKRISKTPKRKKKVKTY